MDISFMFQLMDRCMAGWMDGRRDKDNGTDRQINK